MVAGDRWAWSNDAHCKISNENYSYLIIYVIDAPSQAFAPYKEVFRSNFPETDVVKKSDTKAEALYNHLI